MAEHSLIYMRQKPFNADGRGTVVSVDTIPSDEVCTVYIPGIGIETPDHAERLGSIVQNEVFGNIDSVPNYIVVYNSLDLADHGVERRMQITKRGGNFVPYFNMPNQIYFTEKNVRDVFRRKIAPLLAADEFRSFNKIRFALDGDTEIIIDEFTKLLQTEMEKLGHTEDNIKTTIKHAIAKMRPYDEYKPEYINTLFEKIILPRISDGRGNRLDTDAAAINIRKLNILTHCHGAFVAQMMGDLTESKMHELGYTPAEVNKILSQLLVVSMAPACTVEKSKYRFCSFMSLSDTKVDRSRNWFDIFVWKNMTDESNRFNEMIPNWEWNFAPMLIEHNNTATFMVKRRFEYSFEDTGPNCPSTEEHDNLRYYPKRATNDGKTLVALARNVILSGIKNSLAQTEGFTPLPPTSELILDGRHNAILEQIFQKMTENGKKFMVDVYKFAIANIRKIHPRAGEKIIDIRREIAARK